MRKVVYICTGGCDAIISEPKYQQGLTKCGTESCTHNGQPFEKRLECEQCGDLYEQDEAHSHYRSPTK